MGKIYLMERDSTREMFGFVLSFICLRILFTTTNSWVMTDLRIMINHSLTVLDVFIVLLPPITFLFVVVFFVMAKNGNTTKAIILIQLFLSFLLFKKKVIIRVKYFC